MKWWFYIGIVLTVLVVGCTPPGPLSEGERLPRPEGTLNPPNPLSKGEGTTTHEALQEIDTLMWKQADSALRVMLEFAGSTEVDSLDEFNGHYCQVLVAELLYKNDWGQSNREELLKAVGYFDSIVGLDGVDVQKQNAFIGARAHYINGVGFYEKGDVVNACAEYLKTLEVMEAHFEENELVKKKAIFMTYTYNRLMELFSTQFMMDPAIECGEKALMFCRIEPTSSEGVSNILYRLGKQYDKMHEIDKARQYYELALENISNTDNMVYRDIVSSKALCDYELGSDVKQALDKLNYTLIHAKTENERLNRYLTIGGIHFLERNYDSAIFYLEPVFEDNEAGLQTQAAGYLRIVYDSIGDVEKSNVYMRFLTNQKKPDGENKALVSKLEDLYKNYSNKKLEKQTDTEREIAKKKVLNTVVPIAISVALAIFCVLIWRNRRQLKHQQEKADRALGEAKQEHKKELRRRQVEADKTLEETKNKYEEELRQLKAETEQQLEEVERKHQQWMAKAKERHEEELRVQKDLSEKEIEKTKKRHEEELEAERLAYQAEMAEKEAKAQAERRLHEETLKRHQVETEQRMSEAERKHRQKMEEIARKHELEMQAQHDKTEDEISATQKRYEQELEAVRQAHQQEMEAKAAEARADRERHEEELRRRREQAEQRLAEAEQDHRRKVAELAKRQEEETRRQQEKMEQEREQAKKRHEAELEAERMAYQTEREALRESLRQREAQVTALETAMVQQREEAERRREAFLKEEICQRILDLLHGKHITSRDTSFQHGIGLKEEDFKQLKDAVERHYKGFDNMLLSQCPGLKQSDLTLCHLHLMGLGEGEIAALRSRTYSGIKKQNESLQEKLGVKGSVAELVLKVAEGLCGNQIDTQIDAIDGTRPQKSGWILDKNDRLVQESGMKNMQKSMQKIVMLISASPDITLSEMASQLGMSRNGVDKNIRKLKEQGIIRRVGPDKGGHWEVIR